MERIICDSFDKERAPVWKFDEDSPKTKEFNRKIKAVNDMYAWLYERGILEKISFEFKDYSDSTYFAFDVNDLKPYRTLMEDCGVEDAALAVQNIFDVEYSPCLYSGAIELCWSMFSYRDFDGTVGRSWECSLCRHLNSVGVLDVEQIKATKGVKEAVKHAFELSEFEPSDLVKAKKLDLPATLTIPVAILDEKYGVARTEEELGDVVSDYLSDEFGFCYKGFNITVERDNYNVPIEVVITDIAWDVDEEDVSLDEQIGAAKAQVGEIKRVADISREER